MSIVKPQGLKGLEGIGSLSKADYDNFVNKNKDLISAHNYDPVYINNLYSNKQFIDRFSVDAFKQVPDISMRNKLYKDDVVMRSFKEAFNKDKDYNMLAANLDTQGMLDLMNSDYMGTVERQKRLAEGINASKKVAKDFSTAQSSPFMDVLGTSYMEAGKTAAAMQPFEQDQSYSNKDKEIREKLFDETQKRRESDIADVSNSIYSNILDLDNSGKKSLAQSYNEFDKMADEASPHYKAFKDSKWLKDYTHEDRLKDYAKYQALASTYGEGIAKAYLDRTIQNRVAEAQDGKWTGNTLKKVFATTYSDLGSNIAVLSHLGESPERLAVWNQGKDPDKPIYNEKGNVKDYASNDNLFTNPDYWYDVYKYNTFSPNEIKAIEERGGVSEDVNVRSYGYTPDFVSWDTAEEGFSQVGHILASVVETGLTGSVGKAIGFAGKAAMKFVDMSAKAMSKASKIGAITNDFVVGAVSGLEGPQLEAMGTFEEQLQNNKERIKNQIEHELHDYSQTIDYSSKEAKQAINAYYNHLKKQDQRRVAATVGENTRAFPLSDDILKAQARQMYASKLLDAKQKELEELHRPDEREAEKNAAKTYMTNFIMDYVKEVPITVGIQKFKIAKGSMRGTFDNSLNKDIVSDAATGGVKAAERGTRKAESWLTKPYIGAANFLDKHRVAKEMLKQFSGGFTDEYLDGLNASFSEGMGNADFENYMKRTYNPESYNAVVDGMLGNLLSGMSAGIDGITDRQNLYEGFIGAVSPVVSVAANPNAAFNPHDTWNALATGKDALGNELNAAERLSRIITNPLLNTYADLKERDRKTESAIDAINKVVSANKDKLDAAAKVMSTLSDYSSPIEESANPSSLLDSQDQKLHNAFTLISTLNTLESIDGSGNAKSYTDAVNTLEGLANGTLSQEQMDNEIDEFLADPDNKSILDEGPEAARQVAAERLQKNAQYFMDMKQKMSEISQKLDKSSSMKNVAPEVKTLLAYNLVANDDYKRRLEGLEKELDVAKTDADGMYTPDLSIRYGTAAARQNAIKAREKTVTTIQKEQEDIQKDIDKVDKDIKTLKGSINNATTNDEATAKRELMEKENLKASLELQQNKMSNIMAMAENEKATLQSNMENAEDKVLSEADILSLDARDRWAMLNPENKDNYSTEQQKVIEHTRQNLLQKDPEAEAKLRDASTLATRITDLKEMYSKVLNNSALAADYLNVVSILRTKNATAKTIGKIINSVTPVLEQAYKDRESNPQSLKYAAMQLPSTILEEYTDEHPEQREAFQPYIDLAKYKEDLDGIFHDGTYSKEEVASTETTVMDMLRNSNNVDDANKYLEGIIDSPDIDDSTKAFYDGILKKMENLGYQRDATIIETRAERKKREEEERQRKETGQKKIDEEKKKAEDTARDIKAEQEAAAAEAQANEQLNEKEPANVADINTPIAPLKKGDTVQNEGGDREITPEEVAGMRVSDEVVDWSKMPSIYMTKDAEDGSMEMGNVWYGSSKNPRQGQYTVTKKGDEITFSVDNKKQNLTLSKEDWQYSQPNLDQGIIGVVDRAIGINEDFDVTTSDGTSLTANELANTPFSATRIFKSPRDGKWYAEGQFKVKVDNSVESVDATVELKEDFNLDEAVDRHIKDTEARYAAKGVDTKDSHIIDNGDEVMGKSTDIDGQVAENRGREEKVQAVSEVTSNPDFDNAMGEQVSDNSATTLSGNAMGEYDMSSLIDDGTLQRKKGANPGDNMSKYHAWMDAAGIKLQNIIDEELGTILQKNPHAKVKFMTVRPQQNATNDGDMKTHLLLVLDYDDSINKGITGIHRNANGGVIESAGKKYLVIGTAGFGKYNEAKNNGKLFLWDTLFSNNPRVIPGSNPVGYGLVKQGQGKFFRENPSERFYVAPNLGTEIVPNSLIPGYRVRQLKTDDAPQYRNISDILNDQERNPRGDGLGDLAWGIQEYTKFLVVGATLDEVMVPRNTNRNAGNSFVLIPAANGKLLPAYLKPLFYREMQDGKLKDRVNALLQDVTSPNYATRLNAVVGLSKIFHLDKDGNTFLLRKTRNEVSLVKDGKVFKTFVLGSNFNRQEFMQAIEDMNPRVNITVAVLQNNASLQEYEEAGALMTDVAKLNTVGSSYSIYGVDVNGNMIQSSAVNDIPRGVDSDLRNNSKSQVVYKGQYYRESNGEFSLDGKVITDGWLIEQLRFNKLVVDRGLLPAKSIGAVNYYVLDENKNHVIGINKNTKEVTVTSEKLAKEIIEESHKKEEEKSRTENADKVLQGSAETLKEGSEENVELNIEGGMVIDRELGELVPETAPKEKVPVEDNTGEKEQQALEEAAPKVPSDVSHANMDTYGGKKPKESTQTFKELLGNRDYRRRILDLIRKKWADHPKKPSELEDYLRKKKMDVDTIGTSKEDIEAWTKTLEDCR